MPPGNPDFDNRLRYQHDLPDWEHIAKAWNLLENYSGIPPDGIEPHLRTIVTSPPSLSPKKPP